MERRSGTLLFSHHRSLLRIPDLLSQLALGGSGLSLLGGGKLLDKDVEDEGSLGRGTLRMVSVE